MPGRQAKALTADDVEALLSYASAGRHTHRDRVIVLLSVKAGVRAGEITNLDWDMVVMPGGDIAALIELHDKAAKKGSGRRIPVHPALHDALISLRRHSLSDGPVVQSEPGGRMHAISIVTWFARAYQTLGLHGCSSHSVVARSSPRQREQCLKPVARCATCSYWPATNP